MLFRSNDKLQEFIKLTDINKWKKFKLDNGLTFMIYWDKQFNYTPHRSMQSWSTSKDRAAEFGEAIIIADSKDSNYFMNPEYFSKISYQNDDEHETIHVGKKMKVWIGIEEAWFNDLIK